MSPNGVTRPATPLDIVDLHDLVITMHRLHEFHPQNNDAEIHKMIKLDFDTTVKPLT